MKHISIETREKMSESAKNRCTPEWRKKRSEMYSTPLDTKTVKTMYESGMTQKEIGDVLGVSQKIIWNHMRNNGIQSRKAAKREQSGENNHMWKGSKARYQALHARVYNKLGRASDYGCSVCGRKDGEACYDWANLTGKYECIEDYAPMRRKCHRQYDAKRKAEQV